MKPGLLQSRTGMQLVSIYVLLIGIVVYADLLKRFIPKMMATGLIYGIFGGVALYIFLATGRRRSRWRSLNEDAMPFSPVERRCDTIIEIGAVFLLVIYAVQLFFSYFSHGLLRPMIGFLYIGLPLFLIIAAIRPPKFFDIRLFLILFTLAMLPVHIVGIVQYTVDPEFLVSYSYHETGGVKARNLMQSTGKYLRLPALFASGDRYSAVSALQVLFGIMAWTGPKRIDGRFYLAVVSLAILLGIVGLIVSGTRVRVVLLGLSLFFVLPLWGNRAAKQTIVAIGLAAVIAIGFVLAAKDDRQSELIESIPLLGMLQETFEQDDIQNRFERAMYMSRIREETTMFGRGLGSVSSDGTPGEFGIRALWIESGVFWGLLTILGFGIMILGILLRIRVAHLRRNMDELLGLNYLLLNLGVALLVGLKAFFDISNVILILLVLLMAHPVSRFADDHQRRASDRVALRSSRPEPPTG